MSQLSHHNYEQASDARALVRWFGVLLFATLVLLDLCIYSMLRQQRDLANRWPMWVNDGWFVFPAIRGVVAGQIAIVCVATVWFPTSVTMRILFAGVSLWGLAQLGSYQLDAAPQLLGGFMIYCFILLIPLLIAKMYGLNLGYVTSRFAGDSPVPTSALEIAERPKRRFGWQFTVRSLLSITAAIAIFLMIAKTARFPLHYALVSLPEQTLFAVSSLATVFVILYGWCQVRSALVVFAIGQLIIGLAATFLAVYRANHFNPAVFLINCAFVGTVALILRIAGVRLQLS